MQRQIFHLHKVIDAVRLIVHNWFVIGYYYSAELTVNKNEWSVHLYFFFVEMFYQLMDRTVWVILFYNRAHNWNVCAFHIRSIRPTYDRRYNKIIKRGGVTGVPDLSGSFRLDEVFIDLLGLGFHLHRVLGLLEVLTGHPELNILITELRLQEAAEGIQTIWWRRRNREVVRERIVLLENSTANEFPSPHFSAFQTKFAVNWE